MGRRKREETSVFLQSKIFREKGDKIEDQHIVDITNDSNLYYFIIVLFTGVKSLDIYARVTF